MHIDFIASRPWRLVRWRYWLCRMTLPTMLCIKSKETNNQRAVHLFRLWIKGTPIKRTECREYLVCSALSPQHLLRIVYLNETNTNADAINTCNVAEKSALSATDKSLVCMSCQGWWQRCWQTRQLPSATPTLVRPTITDTTNKLGTVNSCVRTATDASCALTYSRKHGVKRIMPRECLHSYVVIVACVAGTVAFGNVVVLNIATVCIIVDVVIDY